MKSQISILIALLASLNIIAQSFEIKVSSDSVLVGNYIIVSVTANNMERGKFEAPDFDGMRIINGPNISNSIQIVNGEKSSKATYTYHVKPPDVGLYTISPAYMIGNEETAETLPQVINVYPNPENIITSPNAKSGHSFFNFDGFSSPGDNQRNNTPTPPAPPKTPKKVKRKYKKI